MVCFSFSSFNMVNNADELLNVKLTLHLWDKSYLIIIHNPFYLLLN